MAFVAHPDISWHRVALVYATCERIFGRGDGLISWRRYSTWVNLATYGHRGSRQMAPDGEDTVIRKMLQCSISWANKGEEQPKVRLRDVSRSKTYTHMKDQNRSARIPASAKRYVNDFFFVYDIEVTQKCRHKTTRPTTGK